MVATSAHSSPSQTLPVERTQTAGDHHAVRRTIVDFTRKVIAGMAAFVELPVTHTTCIAPDCGPRLVQATIPQDQLGPSETGGTGEGIKGLNERLQPPGRDNRVLGKKEEITS